MKIKPNRNILAHMEAQLEAHFQLYQAQSRFLTSADVGDVS